MEEGSRTSEDRQRRFTFSGFSAPKLPVASMKSKEEEDKNENKKGLTWREFLQAVPPSKENKENLIDWLDFLRTEPPKHPKGSSQPLINWLDFLRSETPDKDQNPNANQVTEAKSMDWIEFLRTEPPSPRKQLRRDPSRAQIESLRTPRKGFLGRPCFPLPEELVIHIISMLELPSIGGLASTNKYMQNLCKDNLLWKIIFFRENPETPEQDEPTPVTPDHWINVCKKELPFISSDWISWSKKEKDPINGRTGLLSSLRSLKGKKKEMRLFLFGLEQSGKTSIVKALPKVLANNKTDLAEETPTKGCTYDCILFKDIQFHMLDVGGIHSKNRYQKYEKVFPSVDAIIVVIDSSNLVTIVHVRKLIDFLVKQPELAKKPLIVLANKKDKSQAMYAVVDIICDIVNRYKEPFLEWYLQTCSAKSGDGLAYALEWLVEVYERSKSKGS